MVGLSAAYISRVSNQTTFDSACVRPLSEQLLQQQLLLMRKVAISEAGGPLRCDTFVGDSLVPQIGRCIRRVGRPRQEWTSQVLREGREMMGPVKMN